jgi:hypothetical protein
MDYENTVLSLNPDGEMLASHEAALRDGGFEVISVDTPLDARFEITMGRCGVFLASSITSFAICRDLTGLFRQSCPAGLVAFVTQSGDYDMIDADMFLSVHDDPQSLVQKIRAEQTKNAKLK